MRLLRTVTASFRLIYAFVVLDISTRRLGPWNVTEYPTAEWTIQQFRAVVTGDEPCRCVIHDRDAICSSAVDRALASLQPHALITPARAPTANAFCERLIGTVRRECLDFMMPLNEQHLRRLLAEWVSHYNRDRPHAKLDAGIRDGPRLASGSSGHPLPHGHHVVAVPILSGLHHEYRLESDAA